MARTLASVCACLAAACSAESTMPWSAVPAVADGGADAGGEPDGGGADGPDARGDAQPDGRRDGGGGLGPCSGGKLGQPCSSGVGACAVDGTTICGIDGRSLECDALPGEPGTERCGDAVDNDCDGETDEHFEVGVPCFVGSGTCRRLGHTACSEDGLDLVCRPADDTPPGTELCGDGADNDCDGDTDEGFDVGEPCEVGAGECTAAGTRVCAADGLGTVCDATALAAGDELCGDDLDNDCDGRTDEEFEVDTPCSAGLGVCTVVGVVRCLADGSDVFCDADVPEPGPELCGDGLDNDCDGGVDEFFEVGVPCFAGHGVCRQVGRTACSEDGLELRCDAPVPVVDFERCGDEVDNDCDGEIDEGFDVGGPCEVGVGDCAVDGTTECSPDRLRLVCLAGDEPGEPTEEACDGRDNDCDGDVDEPPACAPRGQHAWDFGGDEPPNTYEVSDPARVTMAGGRVTLLPVPEGEADAAFLQRVRASSFQDSYAPEQALDHQDATWWRPSVDLSGGPEWLEVDLGETVIVSRSVPTFHPGGWGARDFRIQVSETGTGTDLARGVPVVGSSRYSDQGPELAVDGRGDTFWHTGLRTAIEPASLELDLGEVRRITSAYLDFHVDGRRCVDYHLQVSPTGTGPDLAAGADTYVSTLAANGNATGAVDGDKTTFWQAALPASDGPQFHDVDLGAAIELTAVRVVAHNADRLLQDYALYRSDVPTSENLARRTPASASTAMANQEAGKATDGQIGTHWQPVHATDLQPSWLEVDLGEVRTFSTARIYALNRAYRPIDYRLQVADAPTSPDLASGRVVAVSSQQGIHGGARAVDGDPATMWASAAAPTEDDPPQWIRVDLGSSQAVGGVRFTSYGPGWMPGDYRVELSNAPDFPEGATTVVADEEDNESPSRTHLFELVQARYVRLFVTLTDDILVGIRSLAVHTHLFDHDARDLVVNRGLEDGNVFHSFDETSARYVRLLVEAADHKPIIRELRLHETAFEQGQVRITGRQDHNRPTSLDIFEPVTTRYLRVAIDRVAGGMDPILRSVQVYRRVFEAGPPRDVLVRVGNPRGKAEEVFDAVEARHVRLLCTRDADDRLLLRQLELHPSAFSAGLVGEAVVQGNGALAPEVELIPPLPGRHVRLLMESSGQPGVIVHDWEVFGSYTGLEPQWVDTNAFSPGDGVVFDWTRLVVDSDGTEGLGLIEVLYRTQLDPGWVLLGTVEDNGQAFDLSGLPAARDGTDRLRFRVRLTRELGEPAVDRLDLEYRLPE